jgi:hypothetical protein
MSFRWQRPTGPAILPRRWTPAEIRSRVRVGDEAPRLNVAGVHLLTGMSERAAARRGLAVGAEEGCIPDFRAKSEVATTAEARILSVTISVPGTALDDERKRAQQSNTDRAPRRAEQERADTFDRLRAMTK